MGNYKVIQVGYSDEDVKAHIDEETRNSIGEKYALEDEIKILRKAIVEIGVKDADFNEYNTFVEEVISSGKIKKASTITGKPITIKPTKGKEVVKNEY